MRTPYLLLGAVILSSAFLGCGLFGDEPPEPPEPEVDLFFKAQLNGESWQGRQYSFTSANASYLHDGRLKIAAVFPDFPYYNKIILSIPSTTITTSRTTITGFTYSNEEGVHEGGQFREAQYDAGIADYIATPDTSNYVEVTSYDSTTGIAEGTFAVTFAKELEDRGRPRSRFPDTLRFTDGQFRVRPAIYDNTNTCLRFCEAPDPTPEN